MFRKLAVIGAGNMGSGIAQKMATEGFEVILVDLDDEKVARGMETIRKTLDEGIERKIFRPDAALAIAGRVRGTADWSELAEADLVVEAVFEDRDVKREVFRKLEAACGATTILGTNTSSFSVTEIAEAVSSRARIVGLHYFYHPAKNRLVEVVPGQETDGEVVQRAWSLQEQLGKTPIASADASGFVVNRFFVPWLNEAVRLLEEGVADIRTIEQTCKETFGVGMGPFELMNVTGVPIALHAATTLGKAFGPLYAPAETLAKQVASGDPWPLDGEADAAKAGPVRERMLAVVFYVAAALVDEAVGSVEDTDIGARVGLRWPKGPFEMMNRFGVDKAAEIVGTLAERFKLKLPGILEDHARACRPFSFQLVKRETRDGICTLTINRPDAMNALNEAVVEQLAEQFQAAVEDEEVSGIVLAGAGKAFIAGADIRFFVKNIEAKDLDRIVAFTQRGHELLHTVESCDKTVVARLDGLALGGGLELALACHKIVATPKATMAFPETGIGIYPGLGGTQRAPRRVGTGLAKWLIYTGQMVGAEEAAAIGLVDAVVSHDQLDAAVAEAAGGSRERGKAAELSERHRKLAEFFDGHATAALRAGEADAGGDAVLEKAAKKVSFKAPIALDFAGELIDRSAGPIEEGLAAELEKLTAIFATKDAYEGLSSLGRRKPVFEGK